MAFTYSIPCSSSPSILHSSLNPSLPLPLSPYSSLPILKKITGSSCVQTQLSQQDHNAHVHSYTHTYATPPPLISTPSMVAGLSWLFGRTSLQGRHCFSSMCCAMNAGRFSGEGSGGGDKRERREENDKILKGESLHSHKTKLIMPKLKFWFSSPFTLLPLISPHQRVSHSIHVVSLPPCLTWSGSVSHTCPLVLDGLEKVVKG